MKNKLMGCILALVACAGVVIAAMDDFSVSYSLITTNSDTRTQFCRGELEGVYVDVVSLKTNVVLITMDGQTLFSKDVGADAFYPIRVPMYSTAGAALTFVAGTNNTANVVYGKMPLNGEVTIRSAGDAGITGTNATTIKLMFSK